MQAPHEAIFNGFILELLRLKNDAKKNNNKQKEKKTCLPTHTQWKN